MKARINVMKIFKIAVGSCMAIIIATLLQLSNGVSAGIITLLSIQDTKKETILITSKRMAAFFLALIIAFFCFHLFGYYPTTVGIFLLIFVTVCSLLSLQDGISTNTVLVTHFFVAKSMDWFWIRNEFLILFIGSSIGVFMNLYIPSNLNMIHADQRKVEEEIQLILNKMSVILLEQTKTIYDINYFYYLDELLETSLTRAYANMQNTLLNDTRYYIEYLDMRKNQCQILKRIYVDICRLDRVPRQTYIISDFIKQVSIGFHEYNNVKKLQSHLKDMKLFMKQEPLPVTRKEFENRAILHRIIYELEEFLLLKSEFVENLSEKQIKRYWQVTEETDLSDSKTSFLKKNKK